jgi:SOS-response transcriptional repressor LexA
MSREALQRRLEIHRSNLRRIEEQLAYYGIEPPVFLVNKKEFEQRQISEIEERLAQAQFTTQPSEYKKIGDEILDNLEVNDTRLGEELSGLRKEIKDCLEREEGWREVPTRCKSARKLCDEKRGSEDVRELSSEINLNHAEGIFHVYEGVSYLYQADRKLGEHEESAQLEKAIDCLEKSYGSFRLAGYLDWGNQHLIYEKLGKLSHLKVFSVIGQTVAGKEKLTLDDIIGHMRQTDEFEFEFEGQEGQAVKAELLRGSKLKFSPEYDYVAMLVLEDSMDQAGISPYDCVILQEKKLVPLSPTSGDIVAVVLHDEDNRATLRRFYRDESSRSVRLEPESSNPKQKPRVLPLEVLEGDNPSVEVVGIAIAVLELQWVPRGMLLPVIDERAVGIEKPVSDDDIIVYIQQCGEFFEFDGQVLKAELLKGRQLTFLPEYDYVAMPVSGDSMDQAGISPGDYVILRRKSKHVPLSPTSGDIVAVVFHEDDKATLQRFHCDKSSRNVTFESESSNPKHKPRVLPLEDCAGNSPFVPVVGTAIAVLKPQRQKVIPFEFPVMDEIAAGKEKPASDDIIGYMRQMDEFEFEFEGQALKAELLRGSQLTFLQGYDYVAILVSGDSMNQAGISPNDYVILRRSKPDSSGDIVAVVFRDEDDKATLKRFYVEKPSGRVVLKPESSNPEHKTRVLRPEAFAGDNPSVEIVGIAIAVLKP